jgi:hypothetical protein
MDLFGQKLDAERAASAQKAANAKGAVDAHTALVAELEPKLGSLVLEVFDALRSYGVQPVTVSQNDAGGDVQAYALGRVNFNRWGLDPWCEVAIDSKGKMALRHPVTADKERPHTVRTCSPLDQGYDKLLELASRGDEPYGETRVHLSRSGRLMFTERYIAADDWHHRRTSLAEHLAGLAAKAVAAG